MNMATDLRPQLPLRCASRTAVANIMGQHIIDRWGDPGSNLKEQLTYVYRRSRPVEHVLGKRRSERRKLIATELITNAVDGAICLCPSESRSQ
jgi:hypothetical protein